MADSENTPVAGPLRFLLRPESGLLPRLLRVLRFDPAVYREIEADPHAIPQAFATVIGTSLLVGLGRGVWGFFLGVAGAIVMWLVATALVWAVCTVIVGKTIHFPRLFRGLGFAYLWFSLLIGSRLPWIGDLFTLAAVALTLTSGGLAIRPVLRDRAEAA